MRSNQQTQPGDNAFQPASTPSSHLVIPNVSLPDDSDTLEISTLPNALEVAKCLIHLAAAEDEPEYLTHTRIQKLLYYAQGWSLALRDRALFKGRIEAWAHGPVVKDVYKHFASHSDQPILPSSVEQPKKLTADDRKFIASVWAAYKVHSATSLRNMTHIEAPWKDARQGVAPADRCENEITVEALKRFFGGVADREQAR